MYLKKIGKVSSRVDAIAVVHHVQKRGRDITSRGMDVHKRQWSVCT